VTTLGFARAKSRYSAFAERVRGHRLAQVCRYSVGATWNRWRGACSGGRRFLRADAPERDVGHMSVSRPRLLKLRPSLNQQQHRRLGPVIRLKQGLAMMESVSARILWTSARITTARAGCRFARSDTGGGGIKRANGTTTCGPSSRLWDSILTNAVMMTKGAFGGNPGASIPRTRISGGGLRLLVA
jgi:hypothetical protein